MKDENGVVGLVAVDGNGLCLGAKGNGSSNSSGFIRALSTNSRLLNFGDDYDPEKSGLTICIETESTHTVVRELGNDLSNDARSITLAILRNPS